LQNT